MTWTPGPWVVFEGPRGRYVNGEDGQAAVCEVDDTPDSVANARLIAHAPDLVASLEEVTNWLSGTEVFATSHGAHTAVVEAQKLLARVNGDD